MEEKAVDRKNEAVKSPNNNVCVDCMKWSRFGDGCRVFWEGKKICTMKVTTPEDWDAETLLLKR